MPRLSPKLQRWADEMAQAATSSPCENPRDTLIHRYLVVEHKGGQLSAELTHPGSLRERCREILESLGWPNAYVVEQSEAPHGDGPTLYSMAAIEAASNGGVLVRADCLSTWDEPGPEDRGYVSGDAVRLWENSKRLRKVSRVYESIVADAREQGSAWLSIAQAEADAMKRNPNVRGSNGDGAFEVIDENLLTRASRARQNAAFIQAVTQMASQEIELGPELGHGSYGSVYPLEDFPGWVVKVTTDTTEAAAAEHIRRSEQLRSFTGVPDVRAVFEIPLRPGRHNFDPEKDRLYVIVVEELRTDRVPRRAGFFVADARSSSDRGLDRSRIEYALGNAPKDSQPALLRFADSLLEMQDQGIWPRDLLSPGNILTRGPDDYDRRDYVVADLGVAYAPHAEIPWLDDWAAGDGRRRLDQLLAQDTSANATAKRRLMR